MINLDTGTEIVTKNIDTRLVPASTVKIMTALVTLENITDFNAYVECPYACFDEFWEGNPNYYGASDAAIEPLQDNLTYTDCLYALMLSSACEAANILAYNVAGSIEYFVTMMNNTAEKIGCENTHFTNAHGLYDDDQYTTAYDLYLITKYAMDNYPMFMEICSTYEYEMPANDSNPDGYTKTQTNSLMRTTSDYYFEGVKGIKTGSIDYYYHSNGTNSWDEDNPEEGSRALVSMAESGGYSYLIVTLGAPYFDEDGEESSWNFEDHYNLYEWAFDDFEYTQIIAKNEQIMQVEVLKGQDTDTVGIVTTQDFYALMPSSLDKSSIQLIKPTLEAMTAPITAGTAVGTVELRLNGETLAEIPLAIESDVALDFGADMQEKIMNIITSPWFIAGVCVFVALMIALVVLSIIEKRKRKRARELNRRRSANIRMAPRYDGKSNLSGKNNRRK